MNFKKKRVVIGRNLFYIIIYVFFLFLFPFLRNYFDGSDISVNKSATVLNVAKKSTNFALNSFENVLEYFSSRKSLIAEVDNLQNQLEDEKNKNVVSINNNSSTEGVVIAKKIFEDFSGIYDTILLDKGSVDGVSVGDIVFVYENNAIGKVSKVNKNTSFITLFSKDKEKVEGVIKAIKDKNSLADLEPALSIQDQNIDTPINNQDIATSTEAGAKSVARIGPDKASIVIDLYGYGGGDFVSNIPQNIEVATGTIVYLGVDEDKYLGEIVSVERQDASFYQTLLIKGYYNTRKNDDYYIKKD